MKAQPEPIVSGIHFFPKPPFTCRKRIPARDVTSSYRSGAATAGDAGRSTAATRGPQPVGARRQSASIRAAREQGGKGAREQTGPQEAPGPRCPLAPLPPCSLAPLRLPLPVFMDRLHLPVGFPVVKQVLPRDLADGFILLQVAVDRLLAARFGEAVEALEREHQVVVAAHVVRIDLQEAAEGGGGEFIAVAAVLAHADVEPESPVVGELPRERNEQRQGAVVLAHAAEEGAKEG